MLQNLSVITQQLLMFMLRPLYRYNNEIIMKKNEMKKLNIILSVIFAGILMLSLMISSCSKDSSASYPIKVRMTDAPGPYQEVNVDLLGVEITGNDGKVVMLNVNAGIYNLIDFSNGMDTLIASGELEVSRVEQIRLILGPNNTVVIDNLSYPLSTPSADQSGLKLQLHQTLEAGVVYSILLDFDANKSIVVEGNGNYKLKPVIRTIQTAMGGSISGNITPIGTLAVVTASFDTLSYSTNVSVDGNFMLMGIPEGTYSLTVTPELPLLVVTQNDIVVTTGATTNLETIILQ